MAQWLSEAVSVVEGCGDADAELLLQQGITSLEDLANCQAELLTSIPGINEEGAAAIKAKSVLLAEQKRVEEEEAARLETLRLEQERAAEIAAASEPVSSGEELTPGLGDSPDSREKPADA